MMSSHSNTRRTSPATPSVSSLSLATSDVQALLDDTSPPERRPALASASGPTAARSGPQTTQHPVRSPALASASDSIAARAGPTNYERRPALTSVSGSAAARSEPALSERRPTSASAGDPAAARSGTDPRRHSIFLERSPALASANDTTAVRSGTSRPTAAPSEIDVTLFRAFDDVATPPPTGHGSSPRQSSSAQTVKPRRSTLAEEPPPGPSPSVSKPVPLNRPLLRPQDLAAITQTSFRQTRKNPFEPVTRRSVTPTPVTQGSSSLETKWAKKPREPVESLSAATSEAGEPIEDNPLAITNLRLIAIQRITSTLLEQQNDVEGLLGGLAFTFDLRERDLVFPVRIEAVPPLRGTRAVARYKLQTEYAEHLVFVMESATRTLNDYLTAAGSVRTFSFGESSHYKGKTFFELIYSDWATRQVVLSLEKRLMRRLSKAQEAINVFIQCTEFSPALGFPRVVSPPFTNVSAFAASVLGSIASAPSHSPSIRNVTPDHEDDAWGNDMTENIRQAYAAVRVG